MRILIATNMYPTAEAPYYGSFVQRQAESLRRMGVEVSVAAHLGRPSRLKGYVKGLFDLMGLLRRERFDLIHSHHTYSTVIAILAMRLTGRRLPLIETFHESEIFQRGTAFGQDPLRRLKYSLAIKAWALRRVSFAIPVQRDMLRVVLGEAGAARIPSRVIPVGIDLARFQPDRVEAARQRLGWKPETPVIFFPCDPGKPEKRYDLARAGFELFARDHPGAELVISGKIPDDQMIDTIRAADVILTPTDYETSPSIVKEALACERPVVSTDVGDVKECYADLPGVFICDWTPEDVAARLRQALGAPVPFGGRERLLQLGLGDDQVALRLLDVYRAVLASDAAQPASR